MPIHIEPFAQLLPQRAHLLMFVLGLVAVLCLASWMKKARHETLQVPMATIMGNKDWKATLLQATTQYLDQAFILPSFHPRLILPNHLMDEVRRLPEDKLSLRQEIYNNMHGRYTELGAEHHLGVAAIKTDLTNNIGRMLPDIQEEASFAIETEFGSMPEWTETFLYRKLLHVSALTNGRMFVGLPLSRSSLWLDTCLGYTNDLISVVKAVSITKFLLGSLTPLVAWCLPQVRRLQHDKAAGKCLLRPKIKEMQDMQKDTLPSQKSVSNPCNLIFWIMKQMDKAKPLDLDIIAEEQLFAGFASIHNICVSVINLLFDLAAHPEYIQELRDEFEQVLKEEPNGIMRKTSLPKLRKLDSLLRESQRMNPASLTSLQRLVLAKEGIRLSNGLTIPKGTSIGFMHPFAPWVKTPSHLATQMEQFKLKQPPLDTFYPFRHSEIRSLPGQENGHQFAQTGTDSISFGHGPMACPGRFFAAAEIKCILIEILRRYDVALGSNGEGEAGPSGLRRPLNVTYPNLFLLPDFTIPIYFRNVQIQTKQG